MRELTVVGSANVDLIAHVARLPAPGETVGDGRFGRSPGGKGANQAAAAARLAGRSRFVGAVGDDPEGQWLRTELVRAGVDVTDVAIRTEPTGIALIQVDAEGENTISVCPGANAAFDVDAVPFAPDEAVLTQLEISPVVADQLARKVGGYFAVNAAPARVLTDDVIERADLIIVNETEYEALPQLRTARRVVITRGAAGARLWERGREIAAAASPRADVVSTVGAGDAFSAAIVLALSNGIDPERALAAACAVGSDAVRSDRAQPPLRRLEEYLDAV